MEVISFVVEFISLFFFFSFYVSYIHIPFLRLPLLWLLLLFFQLLNLHEFYILSLTDPSVETVVLFLFYPSCLFMVMVLPLLCLNQIQNFLERYHSQLVHYDKILLNHPQQVFLLLHFWVYSVIHIRYCYILHHLYLDLLLFLPKLPLQLHFPCHMAISKIYQQVINSFYFLLYYQEHLTPRLLKVPLVIFLLFPFIICL